MMKGKKSRRRIGRFILRLCVVLLLLASALTLGVGIAVDAMFERTLPDHFFGLTAKGIAPKFYAYHFTDRSNRLGEAYLLDDDFYLQRGSIYVSYQELPEHVKAAFVTIEDKRFYEHRGVDWYRTVGAAANYLLGFSKSFGASTVTQQLVKNLTGNNEQTLRRKLQEILYAIDLEKKMDKSQILELYLNVIHFAEQCDGIGAAAEHYFSKSVSALSVSEGATLAAIINNPSYYNPIRNPEHNLQRRNLILEEMYRQGAIGEEVYRESIASPLGLAVKEYKGNGISSWYADMVIEDVVEGLCREHGMSRSAAVSLVRSGGLRIDVAMEESMQEEIEEYYQTLTLPKNEQGEMAQSALIAIDNKTGDILGVAGGIGKKSGSLIQSFATQTLRPPGSALKPLSVYAPALELGLIQWSSVFDDVPVRYDYDGQKTWPHNSYGSYRGLTDVAQAIADSTNTISVEILKKVGLRRSFSYVKDRFGIKSLYESGKISDCGEAALGLGQLHYGVTLRELATAYTAFADLGSYHPSRSYYRVLDQEGNILLANPDQSEVVMSQGNAAVMTKMLQGVVKKGTASALTLDREIACAGKTGTTSGDADRWFIGYTPEIVCGVWCGYAYPAPLSGKNACLRIWDDVMHRLSTIRGGKKSFEVPSSLVCVSYCRDSGKIPCEACGLDPRGNRIESGWFIKGSEPSELCDCHVICQYDAESGGVSHGYCPEESCHRTALLRISRALEHDIVVGDAQYAYYGDPMEHEPNSDGSQAYFATYRKGIYGRSGVRYPYNRSCPYHTVPYYEDEADADPSERADE